MSLLRRKSPVRCYISFRECCATNNYTRSRWSHVSCFNVSLWRKTLQLFLSFLALLFLRRFVGSLKCTLQKISLKPPKSRGFQSWCLLPLQKEPASFPFSRVVQNFKSPTGPSLVKFCVLSRWCRLRFILHNNINHILSTVGGGFIFCNFRHSWGRFLFWWFSDGLKPLPSIWLMRVSFNLEECRPQENK